MNRPNMRGSVPNVRKAKTIHEKKQATRNAGIAKLKKKAAARKRALTESGLSTLLRHANTSPTRG